MATPEATYQNPGNSVDFTPAAAQEGGDVIQLNDGRAAVVQTDVAASALGAAATCGIFDVDLAADVVVIDGAPLWWDASAGGATPVPPLVTGDRDFYLGTAQEDVAANTAKVKVALNVQPRYEIDIHRDGGDTTIVKTVVGSTTVEVPRVFNRGGSVFFGLGTTAEAQKVDWLSKRSFPTASNWVLETVIEVITNGDADVVDVNVGVANGTHASDADSIAEAVFFHLDPGADLDIMAESDDDDAVEVAATDTTVNWAVGTPVHLVIDGRDPSDCQLYVNGVLVLSGTTFDVSAAAGPLFALLHAEKSSNDSPFEMSCDMLRVRLAEQD